MHVTLIKSVTNTWCNFNLFNLDHADLDGVEGVYLIWHSGESNNTVCIGQGNIRDRLTQHRADPNIKDYAKLGLYVTWASVDQQYRDDIEVYLANIRQNC